MDDWGFQMESVLNLKVEDSILKFHKIKLADGFWESLTWHFNSQDLTVNFHL